MELFLWRHADALPDSSDIDRKLSKHGHQQARKVAAWLKKKAPPDLCLLVSPAARARQTVAYFHDDESDERFRFCSPLYDGLYSEEILDVLDWPYLTQPTLIVGHQPLIGELADHLLAGSQHPKNFRKSALWHLEVTPGEEQARLVEAVDGDSLD